MSLCLLEIHSVTYATVHVDTVFVEYLKQAYRATLHITLQNHIAKDCRVSAF